MGDRLGTRIPWLSLLFAALLLVLALEPQAEREASVLGWQRSTGSGWQFWSCALVHFSPMHALGDALGLLIGGYWVERQLGPWRLALAWMVVAPLAVLCVSWLQPDVTHVRGASALAVFGLAAAWLSFWRQTAIPRPWLAFTAGLFVTKTVSDALGGYGVSGGTLPEGVQVAWSAHLCAVGCAWMCKSFANEIDSH
ncbi:MAG: rhomboid family intramembrane serine protease [Leptothrix ochracea]|uniref:rhomboid family intramembrane serine protease n=1 Tax=Leptothrix ochracea TaxID=735331 RepID=UPI0034E25082